MNWYKKAQYYKDKKDFSDIGIGTGRPYQAVGYKGVNPSGPIDYGYYGKGNYYAPNRQGAEGYATDFGKGKGEVISKDLKFDNPFISNFSHIRQVMLESIVSTNEFLNNSYAKMSEEEKNEFQSKQVRIFLEDKGHDGIIIVSNSGKVLEIIDFEKTNSELV